jgi:hypothetical protein
MKKMKRYDIGGETDALEAANASEASQDIANEAKGEGMLKGMRDEAAKPKMMKPKVMAKTTPKPTPVSETKPAAKPDTTKMSVNERTKQSIENNLASARSGSGPTDTRSVGQRLRAAFGMKSGGSASSRADGIATKGKTRGKMC